MVTDVRIRGNSAWHSIYAGAVPDSVRVKNATGFPSVVGLADQPSLKKQIRNAAGTAWIPLDTVLANPPAFIGDPTWRDLRYNAQSPFTLTADLPVGIQAGELLVGLVMDNGGSAQTIVGVEDFTEIPLSVTGANYNAVLFYKIADGGETQVDVTTNNTDEAPNLAYMFIRVENEDTLNPVIAASATALTGTQQSITCDSVPAEASSLTLAFYIWRAPSIIPLSIIAGTGWVNELEVPTLLGSPIFTWGMSGKTLFAAEATGLITVEAAGSAFRSGAIGFQLAIRGA